MNTTHTQGPWIVSHDPDGSPDDYCIGVPDGKVDQIAVCSKRDAPIISAAPDMYAALKAVSEMQAANYGYGMETHMKLANLMLQVRAALAKAAP